MPGSLPEGEPVPADGSLPPSALDGFGGRPFGLYVHVPYCRVRCGYCDFNTYTAHELGPGAGGADTYATTAGAEVDLASQVLARRRPVDTIFFGGGTPTLLPSGDLLALVGRIRDRFGLADGAEVTTEANPDSVTRASLEALAEGGFTRVSVGMQSAVPGVLRTLDRTHDPANVATTVAAARAAGLQVSVDLIYGTPGETLDDWRTSLRGAVALEPDHVSAYGLVVEEGTRLAGQVRRGEVAGTDDDDEAAKYEVADAVLSAAGYSWYEVSNWASSPATRCRHNELYWRGDDWWGVGPGAHSHIGGVRWWNVKHPRAYAARIGQRVSPAAARETLTAEQRYDEEVLLGIRLVDGLPLGGMAAGGRAAVPGLVADGLIAGEAARAGDRAVLTRRGRLLADTVVRRLLGV